MTSTKILSASLFVLAAASLSLAGTAQAGRIQDRKVWQQERIGQGVRSGELTPRETARLERQEARLNREERAMRWASCGTLTPRDRAILNRQQNRLSREIYHEKHDGEFRR